MAKDISDFVSAFLIGESSPIARVLALGRPGSMESAVGYCSTNHHQLGSKMLRRSRVIKDYFNGQFYGQRVDCLINVN